MAMWPKTIFSSFHYLRFFVAKSGQSWQEFVRTKAKKNDEQLRHAVTNASVEELRALWENKYGVCTSWAILLVNEIEKSPDKATYWDDSGHRLALTARQIILDSSNRIPAILSDKNDANDHAITYHMSKNGNENQTLSYIVSGNWKIIQEKLTNKIERRS